MYTNGDSGGCCGIKHISQVGGTTSVESARVKLEQLDRITHNHSRHALFTMSLTNRQLAADAMRKVFLLGIKERGWQLVTRFRNPNSGNIVNVFHFTNALRTAKIRNVDMRPCNQGDNNA